MEHSKSFRFVWRRSEHVCHTPGGDRILHGAERRLFTQSLAMIVDLLAQGDADFGVIPFDNLQWNQKLVVLYNSARALLISRADGRR